MDDIIRRIERQAGVPDLASLLAERLAPTDLQSLLLEVYRRLAYDRSPTRVLADFGTDRFVKPSNVSPVRLLEWDCAAFGALPPEVEPITLSPVCPLGTSSAVAAVNQNWAVATARNTEVVSDATNVLALVCAQRRKRFLKDDPKAATPVQLASSHRLLRPQHYDNPDRASHFSLFALCSGGRSRGGLNFELEALGLHIRVYVQALRAFLGPNVALQLGVSDFSTHDRKALLEAQLLSPLREAFPNLACSFDDVRTGGRGYYHDLCFHLYGTSPTGQPVELGDGGVVDWTQRLLGNAKERLVISGIGSERVCSEFTL